VGLRLNLERFKRRKGRKPKELCRLSEIILIAEMNWLHSSGIVLTFNDMLWKEKGNYWVFMAAQ
jgi:hypothetical protein